MIVTNYYEDGQYKKEVLLFSDSEILDEDLSKFQELRDVLIADKAYKLSGRVSHLPEGADQSLDTWMVGNL